MKIRNGFVSNSSSSSFIIKLQYLPKSPEDVKDMLFGDQEPPMFVIDWDDQGYLTDRLCEIIFNDIMGAVNDKEGEENVLIESIYINEYNFDEYKHMINSDFINEYNKLEKKLLKLSENKRFYDIEDDDEKFKKIQNYYNKRTSICNKLEDIVLKSIELSKKEEEIYLKLEYSDNDGATQSFIEHSDFLDPITLVKISNH